MSANDHPIRYVKISRGAYDVLVGGRYAGEAHRLGAGWAGADIDGRVVPQVETRACVAEILRGRLPCRIHHAGDRCGYCHFVLDQDGCSLGCLEPCDCVSMGGPHTAGDCA